MNRRLPSISKAKKTAYIFAALFPGRISIDAAELIASRIEDINNAAVAGIKMRSTGGRLERRHIQEALDEAARARW